MTEKVEKDVRCYFDRLSFNVPITKVVPNFGSEYSIYVRRKDGEERSVGTWDAKRKEFV